MRLLNAFFVIGMTALAPAAEAQVPEFPPRPLLDVPADYQALKPLATDWPRPSNLIYFLSTRYNMGATGPINLRQSVEPRRLRAIESLRGLTPSPSPSSATPPSGTRPPASTPPASEPGRTGERAP